MIEHIEQGTLPRGCKAAIALTSWKKRINTVGLTIYNLFAICGPEFHIVLTLAEEEFPRKERDLPRDLVLMNKAGMFEILWCKRNIKSFKKWLLCSARYPKVPVITADDDIIYTTNYAQQLYTALHVNHCNVVSYSNSDMVTMCGAACCYSPNCMGTLGINMLCSEIIDINEDDMYYQWLVDKLHLYQIKLQQNGFPFIEHDCNNSLSAIRASLNTPAYKRKTNYYKVFERIYAIYRKNNNK